MGKKKKKLLLSFPSLIFGLGDTTVAATATTTTTTKPNPSSSSSSSSSWAWPSCKKQQQQRTDSSRAAGAGAAEESVYLDSTDSFFTHSSEDNNSESFSTTSDNNDSESLIRGLVRSSDRLFVEPGGDTSSILEEAKGGGGGSTAATDMISSPFKESVAMAMESRDPYLDFKESMEEMVAAYGLKDWECLEDLLVWYLRVNGKKTHGYIVGAFVDLLVALASAADDGDDVDRGDLLPSISSSSCCGSSSGLSLSSRNCSYEIEEVEDHAC